MDPRRGAADRPYPVGVDALPTIETASDELRRRALDPPMRFGEGILDEVLAAEEPYVLLTQPQPLALLDPGLRERPLATRIVDSLEHAALDRLVAGLPDGETVVGLGGGMAIDAAKYVAWVRGTRLVLVPGIVSVDACVTNTIAVRESGRVVYRGWVVPDLVAVDFAIVRAAPPRLNRAGLGDVLSIHTALWDWRRGGEAGKARFVPAIARRSRAALEGVMALAPAIGEVADAALEAIVRTYALVNGLCVEVRHSQPQEGSEHYVAYRLEALTGRGFVHGEVLGLGGVLMATLQRNDPGRVAATLDAARVGWRPADLEIDRSTLERALVGLPAFVRESGLPYSVIDEADLSPVGVERLLATSPGLWS